jgi:hypothetical protein
MALADFLPKCEEEEEIWKERGDGWDRVSHKATKDRWTVAELMEIDDQSWGVVIATCLQYPQIWHSNSGAWLAFGIKKGSQPVNARQRTKISARSSTDNLLM